MVFVPGSLVGRTGGPTAIERFQVAEIGSDSPGSANRKSIRVTLKPEENPEDGWVARSRVHTEISVVLVRIGDLGSETALLDPLSKSLIHFLRLLVGDDYFTLSYLRTEQELRVFWAKNSRTTHLILIGHGRRDGIRFVGDPDEDGAWMTGTTLGEILASSATTNRQVHVLNLACLTGYAAFSQGLSRNGAIRTCVAPMHALHGAIASQFTQTLLSEHLLWGRTWSIAFRHARTGTPGTSTFRLWQNGRLSQGTTG